MITSRLVILRRLSCSATMTCSFSARAPAAARPAAQPVMRPAPAPGISGNAGCGTNCRRCASGHTPRNARHDRRSRAVRQASIAPMTRRSVRPGWPACGWRPHRGSRPSGCSPSNVPNRNAPIPTGPSLHGKARREQQIELKPVLRRVLYERGPQPARGSASQSGGFSQGRNTPCRMSRRSGHKSRSRVRVRAVHPKIRRGPGSAESEGTNASPNTIITRGEVLYLVYIAGGSRTPRSSAPRRC
jgi:hypothetical protein